MSGMPINPMKGIMLMMYTRESILLYTVRSDCFDSVFSEKILSISLKLLEVREDYADPLLCLK